MALRPLAMLLLVLFHPGGLRAQTAQEDWRSDVPCASARRLGPEGVGPGEPARFVPCPSRSCVDLPGGGRVCACGGTEGMDSLRVERNGRVTHEWSAETDALSGPGGWEVLAAPIGARGEAILAIAQRTAISNGLGVSYWRLWLVDPGGTAGPAHVDLHEYASGGSWVRPRRGGPCRLFATRWTTGGEPGRPTGLYLQGRWLAWRDGALHADPARPTVERRYLSGFERERTGRRAGSPFAWFRSPLARRQRLPRVPAFTEHGQTELTQRPTAPGLRVPERTATRPSEAPR